ncbi:hypothetical protein SH203_01960 [Brevundimonas sp. SH203]|uniref:hypothetical protein n=1 Tax=Brevundimonas sp. SH203 TaxID=345167 RepID=UPI0009C782A0|nr:hypothetical protein [Brevundimonas sp. SH203]GAW41552.1 hypothetical protein SH203_01960 [Brevundimonas sp. SH203]
MIKAINITVATSALGLAMFGLASPAAAESWAAFSRSDATVYLVDVDALTPVDGVVTTRMARVHARGEATDLSHETEEVMVRCSDGQSRSGATVTYGKDGAETDRYSEDAPWEATPTGGIYGAIKSFACDALRPQAAGFPTIPAFIAAGRGQ